MVLDVNCIWGLCLSFHLCLLVESVEVVSSVAQEVIGKTDSTFCRQVNIWDTIMMLGCDLAFSLYGMHWKRVKTGMNWATEIQLSLVSSRDTFDFRRGEYNEQFWAFVTRRDPTCEFEYNYRILMLMHYIESTVQQCERFGAAKGAQYTNRIYTSNTRRHTMTNGEYQT